MKNIIDWARKGNVVRFYLGSETDGWGWLNPDDEEAKELFKYDKESMEASLGRKPYGDDWDDAPYESNAGPVYDRFVKGHKDVAFGYDTIVLEPSDGVLNSKYSKEGLQDGNAPIIIAIEPKALKDLGARLYEIEGDYQEALKRISEYRDAHIGALPDGVSLYYMFDEIGE